MKASASEVAAWTLMAAGLLCVFVLHLVPALVAGLLVTVLLHRLARRIAGRRFSHGAAKLAAVVLVALLAAGVTTGVAALLVGVLHGRVGDLPGLFQTMAGIVDDTRLWLEERGGPALIPDALGDADELRRTSADWLRTHAATLRRIGGEAGRAILHVAVGIAIGLLVFFQPPAGGQGPLARALEERVRRLTAAFETVVSAQVEISAINTLLTALYLLVALPLAGVHLPFAGTLVAVTFLTGLLPVVGNLLSNTVIVIISLGVSGWVAIASLVFLVVIHKLEYIVNARIVGGRVRAAAWELLIALIVMESAFGVPGVVLAPILYAYVKQELVDRGLI